MLLLLAGICTPSIGYHKWFSLKRSIQVDFNLVWYFSRVILLEIDIVKSIISLQRSFVMCILSEKLYMIYFVTCIWGYRFFWIYSKNVHNHRYLSLTTIFKNWYLRSCVLCFIIHLNSLSWGNFSCSYKICC